MGRIFLTEKQIESWLEFESRDLPMPDGSIRSFTDFCFQWEKFDELVSLAGYTPARLVEFAIEENQLSGIPIEQTLNGCINYLYQHIDFLIAKKKKKDKVKEQLNLLFSKSKLKKELSEKAKNKIKGKAKLAFGNVAFRRVRKPSSL